MQSTTRFNLPKVRILIVDDEISVAMTMRFLLGLAGCETEMATSRAEAIQMAQTSRFDLITLDVSMPDCSGFDLCIEIRKNPRLRHVPVVFVSGRCSLEDQQRGLEMGAADYIAKPFNSSEFVQRILTTFESNVMAMLFRRVYLNESIFANYCSARAGKTANRFPV